MYATPVEQAKVDNLTRGVGGEYNIVINYMARKAGAKTEVDFMLSARKVARWALCEKFVSHIYHSRLSDLELDDFITRTYSQLQEIKN